MQSSSVTGTLEFHHVPYFVTGSLASSVHAEFRATNDIDIVADFGAVDLPALMRTFAAEFHVDAEQARAGVREGTSFNLIHRTSFLKVDFFPAVSAFNRVAIERADRVVLGEAGPPSGWPLARTSCSPSSGGTGSGTNRRSSSDAISSGSWP